MGSFEVLLTNVLSMHLHAKDYPSIWNVMVKDRSVFPALINAGAEDEMIALLQFQGPLQPGEVIDGDFEYACSELLPLAYQKGWHMLCAYIYSTGYESPADPLCGSLHPLVFAASQHNCAFAEAYIQGMKFFDYLTFDGEFLDNGAYRTLLEQLVLIDDADIMALCLKNGANPNAFCFSGNTLLDAARSDRMRNLLKSYHGKPATIQERNLIKAVNELRNDCLKRSTVNEFFSVAQPLLKHNWYHGSTPNSKTQAYDIFFEAALACCPELLQALCPYAELDDKQRELVLRAILGQHDCLPSIRLLEERPVDICRSLEALQKAGFRYGVNHKPDAEHPILAMIDCACWAFSFREVDYDLQLRIFTALWQIGSTPKGEAVYKALKQIAEEHLYPAPLEMFIGRATEEAS